MPHVLCSSCGLTSYVAPPHSGQPLCPHCDADLLPALRRSGATVSTPTPNDVEGRLTRDLRG